MRLCAELADLGMDLARLAAAKAAVELDNQEEPQAVEQQSEPASEPPAAPAAKSRPLSSSAPSLRAPNGKSISWAILFTRLAATVRACVALESRLAAGTITGAAAHAAITTLRTGLRRIPLREILHNLTENHPDRDRLRREFATRLAAALAADPDQTIDAPTLLFTLCEQLNIEIDPAILPDGFLSLEQKEPEPRATSPP